MTMSVDDVLAKFQSRLGLNNRVIIPKFVRNAYRLKSGDYVDVFVRAISIDHRSRTIRVRGQIRFSAQMDERGLIAIPRIFRKKFNVVPGDLLEIYLLNHHEPGEISVPDPYKYVLEEEKG